MTDNKSKILVVYYSLEGNTKMIANSVAEATGGSLLELIPTKDIKPKGFTKYLKGGKQVFTKDIPELMPINVKPEEFDILFIGTPVWAWTFSPAIRAFLLSAGLKGKKIALFSCNGGNNGKTFDNMKEMLAGNEFLGEIEFLDPLKNDKEKNAALAVKWAGEMLSKVNS
jgi:flavodoxin